MESLSANVHFHDGYDSLDLWGLKMMMEVTWRMQGMVAIISYSLKFQWHIIQFCWYTIRM